MALAAGKVEDVEEAEAALLAAWLPFFQPCAIRYPKITYLGLAYANRPHAAGCDSFCSSILKSLTAVTTSIQMDLPVVAGVEDEDQRSDSRLF